MSIYLAEPNLFPGLREMENTIPPEEKLFVGPEIQPFWNHKHTEYTKNLMSKASRGKPKSSEHAKNNGEAHAKTYIITNPNGEVFIIRNLSKFCRENDLNTGTMCTVAKGIYTQHKGYKVKYDTF
tara:strand:+ start:132 stop:506 length:375 start_codon:yes stop_codon:yes gene_type:complete